MIKPLSTALTCSVLALVLGTHALPSTASPVATGTFASLLRPDETSLDLTESVETQGGAAQAPAGSSMSTYPPTTIPPEAKGASPLTPPQSAFPSPDASDLSAPKTGDSENTGERSCSGKQNEKSESEFVWPARPPASLSTKLVNVSPLLAPSIQYSIPTEPYDWGRLRIPYQTLVFQPFDQDLV